MRIVARNAPEPALAGAEAEALVQLLELADDTALGWARCPLQNRPEPIEGKPWPVVVILPVCPQHAPLPIQVALLANGVPKRRFQNARIDDRQVPAAF
jgi:hypothetical protein